MKERFVDVRRTARYHTLGESDKRPDEVWFVCHGYGQLAREFVGYFAAIDDGSRLIVAPEGLSRFYVEHADEGGRKGVVGASWMTLEDRLHEIQDYVSYLDAVYERTFEGLERAAIRVTALGFSQGAPAVCRWVDRGAARVDRLILWGGGLPADIDLSERAPIRGPELILVVGTSDEYVTPARLAEAEVFLGEQRIDYRLQTFDGGHRLSKRVLQKLCG